MKTGIELIAAERARQITTEGFTAAHDAMHARGELHDAAASYMLAAINCGHPAMQIPPREWPWAPSWWKPAPDPVRNLVKAAALLAAEIDRLTAPEEAAAAALVELRREPIDFDAIARESGVEAGTLYHAAAFGWGVHPHDGRPADFCVITPPAMAPGETELRISADRRHWLFMGPASNEKAQPRPESGR